MKGEGMKMSVVARSSRRLLVFVIVMLCLGLAAETVVLAASTIKAGKAVTAVKTVTGEDLWTTNSTTFVPMPGMSTTIKVPSRQHALLLITFSAESQCQGTSDITQCKIRALVDGVEASPGPVVFDNVQKLWEDGRITEQHLYAWETNSMQFVAGPLGHGKHTVTIEWQTPFGQGSSRFVLKGRTLTILRSKVV